MSRYAKTMIFLLSIVPIVLMAETEDVWAIRKNEIHRLRTYLQQKGAVELIKQKLLPSKAPRIHSCAWVDCLLKEDSARKEYEQEVRELGYDFLLELEKLALPNIAVEDVDRLEKHADDLLKIAEWLKTESGYGNYLLKSWAERIALSAIGGLAVNANCRIDRIQRLFARVDGLSRDLDCRLSILNEEGPCEFSRPTSEDEAGISRELGKQWARHFRRADGYFVFHGHTAFPVFEAVKHFPWQYSFYTDDVCVGFDAPSRVWWNCKDHRVVCVVGAGYRLWKMLQGVLAFRQKIGYIPKPDSKSFDFFEDGDVYEKLLNKVWQSCHQKDPCPMIGLPVFMIYSGTFYDSRTQGLAWRLRHERQQQ